MFYGIVSLALLVSGTLDSTCTGKQERLQESQEKHFVVVQGDDVELLGTFRGRHITGPHVSIDEQEPWRLSFESWYQSHGLGARESSTDRTNQDELIRLRRMLQILERQNVIVRGKRIENRNGGRPDDPAIEVESIQPSPQTVALLRERLEDLKRQSDDIRDLIESAKD